MAIGWTLAPVYFVQEVGMDPLQLVLAGTFMEIAYFVFEVPTGVVADSYSRRASVIVAQVIMGVSFVATGLLPERPADPRGSSAHGLRMDVQERRDRRLARRRSRSRSALGREYQRGAQVARVLGLLGIAAAVGLALVDLQAARSSPVVVVLLALGALLAFVMPESGFEPAAPAELSALRGMTHTAKRGGRLVRARPILLLVLGITFFGGMWSESVDRLWEAQFLVNIGVPEFAGLQLDHLVRDPERRRRRARNRRRAAALAPLRERGLARHDVEPLLARQRSWWRPRSAFAFAGSFGVAVLAYWGICVARSLAAPVYSTWLNANIEDSSVRATVISMTNLGDSAGEWGGGPALGLVGNAFGIRAALAAGAAALTPALLLYGLALRRGDESTSIGVVPQVEG